MKLLQNLINLVAGAVGHSVGSGLLHGLAVHLPSVVLATLAGVVTGGLLVWAIFNLTASREKVSSKTNNPPTP